MSRPTSLYRFFDDQGRLLYIGVTSVPRWDGGHRLDKPWWGQVAEAKVEHFDDRATALTAERYAIKHESPEHNVAHNNGHSDTEPSPQSTQSHRHSFVVGDVVCVGIRFRHLAPCGMVDRTDDAGFKLVLFDWLAGMFVGSAMWFPWASVEEAIFAELMPIEDLIEQGWNKDYTGKMYDMEPLGRFQNAWRERYPEKTPVE